jgi:hypothetical protein
MSKTWLGLAMVLAAGHLSGAEPGLPTLAVPDGAGVNIHFTDPRPGEMAMLAQAGFRWVRMDFAWGATEREQGVYDFSAYDRLLAALAPHGIRALFILDYNNPHYDGGLSPCSDEGRRAFANWAVAAVRHFRGQGILWEMYNEPNIGFWKPTPNPDDYVKLALAVGQALRAAEPTAAYIGPATSGIDLPFLETCFKAGLLEYWCAVSVHPYRQTGPETAAAEYRQLRLLIARYAPAGKTIPVLSGEWGYSAAWASFEPAKQGRMLPRQWLTNLANDVLISIWYDWHDDGPDPKEPEHHFGTVLEPYRQGLDPVYEPKPAYLAARTLTTELGGYRYCLRLAVGDPQQDHVLLFARDADVRVAAWTVATTPRAVTIPASPGRFRVRAHTGEILPALDAGPDGLQLTLSDAPVYLSPEAPNDLLRLAAASTRAPLETMAVGPTQTQAAVTLTNVLERSLRVTPAGGTPIDLEPGRSLPLTQALDLGRSADPIPLRFECAVAGLGQWAQTSLAVVSNPLILTVLPAGAKELCVRLENPAGDASAGQIHLTEVSGLALAGTSAAFALTPGQTETTVRFPLSADAVGAWGAGVRAEDSTGRLLVALPKAVCDPVADFARLPTAELGNAFQVVADGDAKVASTQELALVDPPEPCPGSGGRVLRLTYRFEDGWKFVRVTPLQEARQAIAGTPRHLGLWVYGDGQGNYLRLRFVDAEGETFQPGGPRLTWTGWRYITMPVDGRESGQWGLKSDGVVQYPIRWDSLVLLDSAGQKATAGTLYLALPALFR